MKKSARVSILMILLSFLVACAVPASPAPTMQPGEASTSTSTPLASSPTPTSSNTTRPTQTWTQAPSSTSTQALTLDPNTRATITPVPAATCPAVNDSYQPVLNAGNTGDASANLDLNAQLLDALNRGTSLAALKRAVAEAARDGKPADIPPEAIVANDLTGDGVPEIIFANRRLMIYTCGAGKYVEALNWTAGTSNGLEKEAIQDINLDGLNEMIVHWREVLGNVSNNTFSILRWNGSEFVDLVKESDAVVEGIAEWSIRDVDGKDGLELVVRDHAVMTGDNLEHGPWRDKTDTFGWDGAAYVLKSSQLDPPEYRFQAVQDGDRAMRSGEYAAAIPFFRQAIEDPKLKGWGYSLEHNFQRSRQLDQARAQNPTETPLPPDHNETPTLVAYAHFRTMQAYVGLGDRSAAQAEYETLQKKYLPGKPGSVYAALAKLFWEGSQNGADLPAGCAAVKDYANQHEEEILGPLNNYQWGFQNLSYEAENLCIP